MHVCDVLDICQVTVAVVEGTATTMVNGATVADSFLGSEDVYADLQPSIEHEMGDGTLAAVGKIPIPVSENSCSHTDSQPFVVVVMVVDATMVAVGRILILVPGEAHTVHWPSAVVMVGGATTVEVETKEDTSTMALPVDLEAVVRKTLVVVRDVAGLVDVYALL